MRISTLLKSSLFAAAATVLGSSAAFAGAVSTWSPSAVGLVGGNITNFDNFNVNDFAVITVLDGLGNFTEKGVLNIKNGFLNGGVDVPTVGLGTTYSLFYTFTATGNQGGPIPTVVNTTTNGTFSSLTFTLWGRNTSTPTFTVGATGVTVSGGGAFALATGSLLPGQGVLSLTLLPNGTLSPKADVEVTLDPCTAAGGGIGGVCSGDESAFFVSPSALTAMFQIGDFSATGSQTSLHPNNQVWIIGGGGNITQEVPEPFTLSLFGAGLAGAAAMRRRKAKKA